jgi:aryl-alcohol dehydrogenase-like predicted oxidoreductase
MKLALGTVQFGLDYGVSNRRGQVPANDVSKILSVARDCGVEWLDTAAAYGSSESVLGELKEAFPKFRICTKTAPIAGGKIDTTALDRVKQGFAQSLTRLRQETVDLLMVHHAGNLLLPGGEGLYAFLADLKSKGVVGAIGFSAYDPDEVDAVLDRFVFDAVQVPLNVLDQRMATFGALARLREKAMSVFVRSIFLQGVFLSDETPFAAHPSVVRLKSFARDHNVSTLQVALGFVRHAGMADGHAVVGVTSPEELTGIAEVFAHAPKLDFTQLASDDADLIDPRRWPRAA